jgi:hypothetical protein
MTNLESAAITLRTSFHLINSKLHNFFQILLDPKCVNTSDIFTRDCLTYAVQFDQLDILRFLLENGANINSVASGNSFFLVKQLNSIQIIFDI